MDYKSILSQFRTENRLRAIPGSSETGRIDLLSNDYMGLAARSDDFKMEFIKRFGDAQFTSAASRLLSRRQKYHLMLEDILTEQYNRPALLFNSGYHANVGLIQSLAIPGTLIISDRLIHASSIDGIQLSKRDFRRFAHNDMTDLRKILTDSAHHYDRVILLLESIYSMDGDIAPLHDVIALKREFPNMLICLDEAHAFGVRGEKGLGIAEEEDLLDKIDIIVGTLGKAAASAGAFVVASEEIIDMLINTARSFIFSTALPPANCAWSILMIEKLMTMAQQREYLKKLSSGFIAQVVKSTGIPSPSSSQIVPLIIGDAAKALQLAELCKDKGYDCMAIRRPTVPPGGERIRLSLNATLEPADLNPLIQILSSVS